MEEENSVEFDERVDGEVSVQSELPSPESPAESIDEKAEINRLLDEGYSVKQIIDLGFKRRTAYYYAKNE